MRFVVKGFQGKKIIDNPTQLEAVLSLLDDNDSNAFWLYCKKDRYPAIHMLVIHDLAALHYYATDSEAGSRSVGMELQNIAIGPDGNMNFYLSSNSEELEVWNDMVLPFHSAFKAAKEFFESQCKPTSIDWEEL